MNGFSITPFHGLHLLLLLLTASATILIFLLLRGKREARRANMLISVCLCNLALFTAYKLSLSRDAVYVSAYYPNGFNLFNELPLHLCNINLFLIPLGVWRGGCRKPHVPLAARFLRLRYQRGRAPS